MSLRPPWSSCPSGQGYLRDRSLSRITLCFRPHKIMVYAVARLRSASNSVTDVTQASGERRRVPKGALATCPSGGLDRAIARTGMWPSGVSPYRNSPQQREDGILPRFTPLGVSLWLGLDEPCLDFSLNEFFVLNHFLQNILKEF
jgi:hypothetical protein